MTAATFDTLTAARDLEAAGVERRQAEAIAGAVHQAAGADRADLATKADLAEVRAELSNFATKADLHREIGTLRSEMRWMFAFQGALILAMAAKLFGFV